MTPGWGRRSRPAARIGGRRSNDRDSCGGRPDSQCRTGAAVPAPTGCRAVLAGVPAAAGPLRARLSVLAPFTAVRDDLQSSGADCLTKLVHWGESPAATWFADGAGRAQISPWATWGPGSCCGRLRGTGGRW